MGIKKFLMKKALQMKGVSSDQAEQIASEMEQNPELAESMKKLEGNKEVMALFKKIQAEIEVKKKGGMDSTMATFSVMSKYKKEIQVYQEELAPLMGLFTKR